MSYPSNVSPPWATRDLDVFHRKTTVKLYETLHSSRSDYPEVYRHFFSSSPNSLPPQSVVIDDLEPRLLSNGRIHQYELNYDYDCIIREVAGSTPRSHEMSKMTTKEVLYNTVYRFESQSSSK
jgi:hypothetical protein